MPQPVAIAIRLSEQQKRLLEQITRARTNPYRLVQRAQLILWASEGMTNTEIASSLRLTRGIVRLWRTRWLQAAQKWEQGNSVDVEDETLLTQIISMLTDQPRRGNPGKFSLEEIVQIIAVACEIPATSSRPVSHWTRARTCRRSGPQNSSRDFTPKRGSFFKIKQCCNHIEVVTG